MLIKFKELVNWRIKSEESIKYVYIYLLIENLLCKTGNFK